LVEVGVIIGLGEGEDGQAGPRVSLLESADDHFHGSAGGEDIVNNEEGGKGLVICGEGAATYMSVIYIIEALEFGFPLFLGEPFDLPGREGFAEQAGEVMAVEMSRQRFAQLIHGAGAVFPDEGFIVVQGADDGGVRGNGSGGRRKEAVCMDRSFSQDFQGAVDPPVEVGLAAPFEFQEAMGEGVLSHGYRQVVAQIIVRVGGVFIWYG
jgi:hypothetical protein